MSDISSQQFDSGYPGEKEARLRSESESWDTSNPQPARAGDIPVLDLERRFSDDQPAALEKLANELYYASTRVGFYYVTGHGVPAKKCNKLSTRIKGFMPCRWKPNWPFRWTVQNGQ